MHVRLIWGPLNTGFIVVTAIRKSEGGINIPQSYLGNNSLGVPTGSRGAIFDRTRLYFLRIVAVLIFKLIALHKICTTGQITYRQEAAESVYSAEYGLFLSFLSSLRT